MTNKMKKKKAPRRGQFVENMIGKFIGRMPAEPKRKRVISSKPLTEAQELVMNRFRLANNFASKFRHVAKIGFDEVSLIKGQTGLNWLVSDLLKNCITGDKNHLRIDFMNMRLSEGWKVDVLFPLIKLATAGRGKLEWMIVDSRSKNSDQVYLCIYNESTDQILYSGFVADRSAQQVDFELDASFQPADLLHCWVFAKSFNSRHVSDSEYIERLTIINDFSNPKPKSL